MIVDLECVIAVTLVLLSGVFIELLIFAVFMWVVNLTVKYGEYVEAVALTATAAAMIALWTFAATFKIPGQE